MARLREVEIEALRKKAGFIKVMVKDGYEEWWVSVNDLIDSYLEGENGGMGDDSEDSKVGINASDVLSDVPKDDA